MPNENEGPLDISLDLSQTKTQVPLIADGVMVELRLANITKQTSPKGDSLKFEYDITQPVPNTEGGQILPGAMGAKQFENIQLYAKPDAKDPKWFEKKIATRMDALLGTGDAENTKGKPDRPQFNSDTAALMVGKTMLVKMKVKTGEYVGNEFGAVYFPGDIQA